MAAITWIRRSLRKKDNTALVRASEIHDSVIPLYVIDENYFEKADLGYPRVRFWSEALESLKEDFEEDGKKLVVRKGKPLEEIRKLAEQKGAEKVYYNRDYSPYARKRDSRLEDLDIETESFKDIVMFEKDEILTNKGEPYSVYSYYRDKWFDREKERPRRLEDFRTPDISSKSIPGPEELGYQEPEELEWCWNASREGGTKRLEDFRPQIWNYEEKRDLAAEDATSRLSPHLKFGTVSIREAFWMAERLKVRNPEKDTSGLKTWQEELAWRDFYFQMLYHNPETVEKPYLEQYESIEWRSRDEAETAWKRFIGGRTGYPFIDAGMRQLRREGWMHNRLRMAATSFACKDLWLDWRDIHDYFSRMFVDAELSAMVGGIQWAYSIGTDAQPYFRVFNPWKQGEKFDPGGDYIRKYVPELRELPDSFIHRPHETTEDVQQESGVEIGEDYPEPIVDHGEMRKKSIQRFEEAKED